MEDLGILIQAKVDLNNAQKTLDDFLKQNPKIDIQATVTGERKVTELADGLDSINKKSVATVGSLYLLHKALRELEQAAKQMIATAASLDKQLTGLRMVTETNYNEAAALVRCYRDLAFELAATTSQVLEASDQWLRQGRSIAETTELITQSLILSKTGAMSASEATKSLTSAMHGYGLAVDDVSGIVDKLVSVDLAAAVSAQDLAVAMSRTASSASIAGISMDRLLGYVATVQETTQKTASTIGESFKTIFARMGNVKLGKFLDDDGEDISDVESVLKSFNITLRNSKDEFRDFDGVLEEVGVRWDTFTTVQKRAIATTFAGVRQYENFLTLMENYDKALRLSGVAADSAGNAYERFGVYLDSVEAKMAGLKNSVESLSFNTFNADFIKGAIDAGTSLIKVVDNLDLLKHTLVTLTAIGAVKFFGILSGGAKELYSSITQLSTAFKILDSAAKAELGTEQFDQLLTVTNNLTAAQVRLIVANKALTTEQRMAILMSRGMTEAEAEQTLALLGLTTATSGATVATFSLSGALKALFATIAANPIGFLVVGLSAAISVISSATSKANQAQEEMRRKTLEVAKSARDQANSLQDLTTQYTRLGAIADRTMDEETRFKSVQEQIIPLLSERVDILAELTAGTREYTDAVNEAASAELTKLLNEIRRGRIVAAKELEAFANVGIFGLGAERVLIAQTSPYYNMISDLLDKYLEFGAGTSGRVQMPEIPKKTDRLLEFYADFQIALQRLDAEYNRLFANGDKAGAEAIAQSTTYLRLAETINNLSEPVGTYLDLLAEEAQINYVLLNGYPKTIDQLDKMKVAVFENLGIHQNYRNIIYDIIDNAFPALHSGIDNTIDGLEGLGGASAVAVKSLKSLADAYTNLNKAIQEMVKDGGLSPATALAFIDEFGDRASEFLSVENGLIKLNTTAYIEYVSERVKADSEALRSKQEQLQAQKTLLEQEQAELIRSLNEAQKIFTEGNRRMADGDYSMRNSGTYYDTWLRAKREAGEYELALESIGSQLQGLTTDIETNSKALELQTALFNSITETDFVGDIDKALQKHSEAVYELERSTWADRANASLALYKDNIDGVNYTFEEFIALSKQVAQALRTVDEQVKSLDSSYKILSSAVDEFNEFNELSIKTVLEVISLGDDYINMLEVTDGKLRLNADAIDAKIAALKAEMIASTQAALAEEIRAIVEDDVRQKTEDMASATETATEKLAAVGRQALETAGDLGALIPVIIAMNQAFDTSYSVYGISDEAKESIAAAIKNAQTRIDTINAMGSHTSLNRSSGGGSRGGGSRDVELYIGQLNRLHELEVKLADAQKDRKNAETQLDITDNLKQRVRLMEDIYKLMIREQDTLRDMAKVRRELIRENIAELESHGFQIDYDDKDHTLFVKNWEHINDIWVKGDTEKTNELRKNIEKVRDAALAYNDANRADSAKWWDLEQTKVEYIKTKVLDYMRRMEAAADRMLEKQREIIEENKKLLRAEISAEEARLSIQEKHFDLLNQIASTQRGLTATLKANKESYKYLDPKMRKLIFNEDDFEDLYTALGNMHDQAESLHKSYMSQISALSADEMHKAEYLTREYQRQLEIIKKTYAMRNEELNLEKARLNLKNVQQNRNVRMFLGEEIGWQWVADPKAVREAMERVAEAEDQVLRAKSEIQQTQVLQQHQAVIDNLKQNEIILDKSFETLQKEVKTQIQIVRDMIQPAETMEEILKEMAAQNLPELKGILESVSEGFGGVETAIQNFIDYMASVSLMDLTGEIAPQHTASAPVIPDAPPKVTSSSNTAAMVSQSTTPKKTEIINNVVAPVTVVVPPPAPAASSTQASPPKKASVTTVTGVSHLTFDKGGILQGIGGIKATPDDEVVFGPETTLKMLEPKKNKQFEVAENAIDYLTTSPRITQLQELGEKLSGLMSPHGLHTAHKLLEPLTAPANVSNVTNNANNTQSNVHNYNLQVQGIIEKVDPNENIAEMFTRLAPLYKQ